jgi:tetratricopeptide (TPR) repeat protein
MQYQNSWQKEIGKGTCGFLICLLIIVLLVYQYILFARLSAENYLNIGQNFLKEARAAPGEELIIRSLAYRKSLRMLDGSIMRNPYDSRAYFEYAEILNEIDRDARLRSLFDKGDLLEKIYTEAILREPTDGIYHQRLGERYRRLSEEEKAEREFKNAVLLDPQNASLHLYLSQYFFYKNNELSFLYHIKKTIELGDKRRANEFLESIGRQDLIAK